MHTRYTAHTAGVLHVYMAQLPTCGGACGSCTGTLVAVYVASAPVAAAQAQHGTRQHVAAHTAHSTAAGGTWQHTQLTAHVAQATSTSTQQAHGTKYHRPLAGVPCPSSCAGQATAQTPRGLGLSRRPGSYVGTLCWCLLYWWLYVGAYSMGGSSLRGGVPWGTSKMRYEISPYYARARVRAPTYL